MNYQNIFDYLDIYLKPVNEYTTIEYNRISSLITDEEIDFIYTLDIHDRLNIVKLCKEKGVDIIETYILLK